MSVERPVRIDRASFMDKLANNPSHHETGAYGEDGTTLDEDSYDRAREPNGRFAKRKPSLDPSSKDFDPEADEADLEADDFDPEADDDEEQLPEPKGQKRAAKVEDDEDFEEDEDSEKKILGRKLKAKIDGVEEEVSVEEMLRSYQKSRAADERLRNASAIEKDLAQRQQQLLELQNRLLEQSQSPKREDPAKPSDEDAEKELMDAIFSGDEKRAAKALAERDRALEQRLSENFSRKTIEFEQQVVRKASEAASEQAWGSYIADLAADRQDVASDRFLTEVFNAHLAEAVGEKGKTREAIKQASEAFDEWAAERGIKIKSSKKQQEREQSSQIEDRARRVEKSKRLSVGTPASAKSKAEPKEVYKTGSSAIQEIAAQRKPWLAAHKYGQ